MMMNVVAKAHRPTHDRFRQSRICRAIIENHDITFKLPDGGLPGRQIHALVYQLDEGPPTRWIRFRLIGPGPQRRRPGAKLGRQLRSRGAGDTSQVGGTKLTKKVRFEESFDGGKAKFTSHIDVLRRLLGFAGHARAQSPHV